MTHFRFSAPHQEWPCEEQTPARPPRYLARNPELNFVARCATRLVGRVMCGHDGRRGYLQHLAVGTALVGRCLVQLRRLGDRQDTSRRFHRQCAGSSVLDDPRVEEEGRHRTLLVHEFDGSERLIRNEGPAALSVYADGAH